MNTKSHSIFLAASAALIAASSFGAVQSVPKNLGLGLRSIAIDYQNAASAGAVDLTKLKAIVHKVSFAQQDGTGRVLVDIYLDGSQTIPVMQSSLASSLGLVQIAAIEWYRAGVISGWLPVSNAAALGTFPGVRSARVAPRPIFGKSNAQTAAQKDLGTTLVDHALKKGGPITRPALVVSVPQGGVCQSQGKLVLHADQLQALGYDGSGGKTTTAGVTTANHPITIGALSDSFNDTKPQSGGTTTPPFGVPDDYLFDQQNDDLPGPSNPNLHLTPVTIEEEDPEAVPGVTATDEGRGMLQVIHDLVPYANLAFATAEGTEANFANNIIALGAPTTAMVTINPGPNQVVKPGAGAQVVCDDVSYIAEPIFSDGVIAQAIDKVATQKEAHAGMSDAATYNYDVHYFSSAGNDGNAGYIGTFTPTPAKSLITPTVDDGTNLTAVLTGHGAPAEGLDFSYAAGDSSGLTTTGIARTLYSGGLHSFTTTNGQAIVAQHVRVGSIAAYLNFQWDDPFDDTLLQTQGFPPVTTDYTILVFDRPAGTPAGAPWVFESSMSGTSDKISANQPLELPSSQLTASTDYYIVIARDVSTDTTYTGPTNSYAGNYVLPPTPIAQHLRYVAPSDGGGFSGDFIFTNSPEMYGHNTATNCSGTGAYVYDSVPNVGHDANHTFKPTVEGFLSNGPVTIYFDEQGKRLASGVIRKQPIFCAVDGGDTSFFPPVAAGTVLLPPGVPPLPEPSPTPPVVNPTPTNPNDYDGDTYPNFFGTSEAAPHAAAVCALLLDAAYQNNLGTVTPQSMRSLLASTTQVQAFPIDTAPDFISTVGSVSGDKVGFSGRGESSTDPNTFTVSFITGNADPNNAANLAHLTSLQLNIAPSGLVFDTDPTTGFPFTQGSGTGGATLSGATVASGRQSATLTFTVFTPGDTLTFGVDRDVAGINAYGNGFDQLQGSTFTATVVDGNGNTNTVGPVTLTNVFNKSYNFKAGYGFIDAVAALHGLGITTAAP